MRTAYQYNNGEGCLALEQLEKVHEKKAIICKPAPEMESQDVFLWLYASLMVSAIRTMWQEFPCIGCTYNHPSLFKHMDMTGCAQRWPYIVDVFFDEARSTVDYSAAVDVLNKLVDWNIGIPKNIDSIDLANRTITLGDTLSYSSFGDQSIYFPLAILRLAQ